MKQGDAMRLQQQQQAQMQQQQQMQEQGGPPPEGQGEPMAGAPGEGMVEEGAM